MSEFVSPEAWRRIQPLLDRALELTPTGRSKFLDEVSGDDAGLRAELERMLIDCGRSDPLLERPAFERFQSLLEHDENSGPALTEGLTIAERYVIDRAVGHGGSATVYLARDLKHDRAVALKVLHSDLAAGHWGERFIRETHLTSQLQHPNILPLHDSGEVGATLYFVMPFVEGESLRQRLAREHQLPVSESVRITCEVARALDYAHGVGVFHRDVKPENILLSHDRPLLADFGIARSVAGVGDSLTKAGSVLGTPAYMAPEQASAETHVDGRSDLYALACVLYELLTGQPPYSGPTSQSVLLQHMGAAVPSASVLRPSISPALAAVVQRALAKRPVDRFATGAEFARELERASGLGTTTRSWRLRSVSRRAPQVLLSGFAIMIVGAAILWILRTAGTDGTDTPSDLHGPETAGRVATTASPFGAPPATPGNLAALSPAEGTVVLSWTDNSFNETRFEVTRDGVTMAPIATDATSVTYTGLRPGISYHWDLRACNPAGCSPYHGVVGKTPDGSGGGAVMTFSFLTARGTGYTNYRGPYSEAGFTVSANRGFCIAQTPLNEPSNFYAGSTGLFNCYADGVNTLTKTGGGTFALVSIDLAPFSASFGGGAPVTFVGQKANGSTVSVTFKAPSVLSFKTYLFNGLGFSNLTSVTWTHVAPYHQFDNITAR